MFLCRPHRWKQVGSPAVIGAFPVGGLGLELKKNGRPDTKNRHEDPKDAIAADGSCSHRLWPTQAALQGFFVR